MVVKAEESHVQPSHADLIRAWDKDSFARGQEIFNGLCITCHGNQKQEGSLPTALRFYNGTFKNGSDPISMYQTITKGFGQMVAQSWMTPQQKYDVIHFIRESQLKDDNPSQYVEVDENYLASEKAMQEVEAAEEAMAQNEGRRKYLSMNFGPNMNYTYKLSDDHIVQKGIMIRLDVGGPGGVSKGHAWMLYDHDLMNCAVGYEGDDFIDWKSIAFDGSHNKHTSIVGERVFTNPTGPGWANPKSGSFDDPRPLSRQDGHYGIRPYGPLPRDWVHYKGLYHYDDQVIIKYTVGKTTVLEMPGLEHAQTGSVFSRTFQMEAVVNPIMTRIAPNTIAVTLAKGSQGQLVTKDGFTYLTFPKSTKAITAKVLIANMSPEDLKTYTKTSLPALPIKTFLTGGHRHWDQTLTTKAILSEDTESAYVVDELQLPRDNPWSSWLRLGGFDFFKDSSKAAVCTWMGDVWIVEGLGENMSELKWTRIATGMFQPLGVKVIDDQIYVGCRDQIVKLHDLNGDGETDFYESFNNDHQVTEHFHEFAMGLQTDKEGNFYYAKSARHAKPALVPHHGTLLKVSKDGKKTEIIATGFRAANGVCVNDDGTFFVTDQEGHWTPKNRVNWVDPKGGPRFYGNYMGFHHAKSEADEDMEQPLVWLTNKKNRSPGELAWVTSSKWGPLEGALLDFSYGTGYIFIVPHEKVNGLLQGGEVELPIPVFDTGVMRGRFNPTDGQLYACGLFAWAGNRQTPGAMYRVRYTGKEAHIPITLNATTKGLRIVYTDPLDRTTAEDPSSYLIKSWDIHRTRGYGSSHQNEKVLEISSAQLDADGKTIFLTIPDIKPTWCMSIDMKLKSSSGREFKRSIHNTIHNLAD
jgi:glucose/arabinose dehydrogenase